MREVNNTKIIGLDEGYGNIKTATRRKRKLSPNKNNRNLTMRSLPDAKSHISDKLFEAKRDLSIHQRLEQAKEESRAQKRENKQAEHKRNNHGIGI